jgi:hypothetical protein
MLRQLALEGSSPGRGSGRARGGRDVPGPTARRRASPATGAVAVPDSVAGVTEQEAIADEQHKPSADVVNNYYED